MSSKPLLKKIVSLADDKKAENIVALDVSNITSLSEYFVVCSASNLIQVKAIADNIKENISENPWKTEAYREIDGDNQRPLHFPYGSFVAFSQ
mgnify:CR=1 FL=1